MVTTAEPDRIRQARELLGRMNSEGLKLAAIVINRFLDERTWSAVADLAERPLSHLAEISELRSSLARDDGAAAGLGRLVRHFEDYRVSDPRRDRARSPPSRANFRPASIGDCAGNRSRRARLGRPLARLPLRDFRHRD